MVAGDVAELTGRKISVVPSRIVLSSQFTIIGGHSHAELAICAKWFA